MQAFEKRSSSLGPVALLVAVLFACTSAQMVERRAPSPYGPQNAQEGGRVRYLVAGMESVVSSRREDAYRQMYDECRGAYVIAREWDENDGSFTNGWGQSNTTTFANGNAYASAYGNQYNGSVSATGTSQTIAQTYTATTTTQWHNIEFNCAVDGSRPASHSSPGEELAMQALRRANVIAQLSLETGCASSTIQVKSEAGASYLLVACGRAFVCIESQPSPSCRAAPAQAPPATPSAEESEGPPK